jgi:hypothetical protein
MQVSQVKRRTKKVIGSNHKRSDVWGWLPLSPCCLKSKPVVL